MAITINGTIIPADEFAWDGCHKIYVITDQESRDELVGYGYDILPVSKLREAWDDSCSLRFINEANLNHTYVSQDQSNDDIRISV